MKFQSSPLLDLFATLSTPGQTAVPDAELLARFADERDEEAFAELVRRYGPMVWRTARVAGSTVDAEDAFQATFLALVRSAGSVRKPAALAGWLHRTARRAAGQARRSTLPVGASTAEACSPSEDPLDRMTARELMAAVDEEVAALPDALRAPLLLCGLDGLAVGEAARQLEWSAGSVKGRLERARARLRRRLSARGLVVPVVFASVAVPARVVAAGIAVGRGGATSPRVARLAAGATASPTFWWTPALVAALVVGGLAMAPGSVTPPTQPVQLSAAPPPRPVDRLVLWSMEMPARGRLKPGDWFGCDHAIWTPDGKHVLTPGVTVKGDPKEFVGEVRIWEAATGLGAGILTGDRIRLASFGGPSVPVAVSPDGKAVAASGYRPDPAAVIDEKKLKHFVFVWDRATPGQPRVELETTDLVTSLCFDPTGRSLFTLCLRTGRLAGWNAATGKRVFEATTPRRDGEKNAGGLEALGFACHPSGKFLVVIQNDVRLSFWDPVTGACFALEEFPSRSGHMWPAFSPDGNTLVAVGHRLHDEGVVSVDVWDVDEARGGSPVHNGRTVKARSPSEKFGGIHQADFSPDGRLVALAGHDNVVRLLDLEAKEIVGASGEHTREISNATFSPDGKWLLTAGTDATKVWSVAELLRRHRR